MLISMRDLVKNHKIKPNCILHVGAHLAEEKDDYDREGVKDVIWVEANPGLIDMLRWLTDQRVYNYAAHEISDLDVELIIAGQSSSILEFKEHLIEHPHVKPGEKVSVKTIKIDDLLRRENIDATSIDMINLDIQGAELLALKGASELLHHVKWIYTEVNVKELYSGCCMMNEIDDYLTKYSFFRAATQMTPHGWGDALYIKTNV